MELSLYRVYSNGSRKFVFSEESENVDLFTMGFKDEEDLIDYLSKMPKVYKKDGSIDKGRFIVVNKSVVDGKRVESRYPILYGCDVKRFILELNDMLHTDKVLLAHLLESHPTIFENNITPRLLLGINNDLPTPIYKLNVDTFSNTLFSSNDFKRNFRSVINTVSDYYVNSNANREIASSGKGQLVKTPNSI